MCSDVVSLGEILVEIMRKDLDVPHNVPGVYLGPYPSGAPAIFIDAAANLHLNVGFIGVVGRDEFGDLLIDRLKSDGVDIRHVRISEGYTTGTTFVMYYSSGTRKFIFHLRHSAAGQLSPENVKEDYIKNFRAIHIMGSSLAVSESSLKACYKAAKIAKESDAIVSFDPNLRPELLDIEIIREICRPIIELSQLILPSSEEAKTLTGVSDPIRAGKKLVDMGPEIAVIKMGAEGAFAVTREGKFFEPSFDVVEVDPTGAGDVYDAAFIYGFLKDWPLSRIMEFASATGAIKVTKFGPMNGPKSLKEVEDFIKNTGKKATR